MNEDAFNMSIRKFLKKVGVTSQREIEAAIRAGLAQGKIDPARPVTATVLLTIGDVDLSVTISMNSSRLNSWSRMIHCWWRSLRCATVPLLASGFWENPAALSPGAIFKRHRCACGCSVCFRSSRCRCCDGFAIPTRTVHGRAICPLSDWKWQKIFSWCARNETKRSI